MYLVSSHLLLFISRRPSETRRIVEDCEMKCINERSVSQGSNANHANLANHKRLRFFTESETKSGAKKPVLASLNRVLWTETRFPAE